MSSDFHRELSDIKLKEIMLKTLNTKEKTILKLLPDI